MQSAQQHGVGLDENMQYMEDLAPVKPGSPVTVPKLKTPCISGAKIWSTVSIVVMQRRNSVHSYLS